MNDDSSTELEARLRAWRPAALPPALHARLLAAEPPPRRQWHRPVVASVLALLFGAAWWLSGSGSEDLSSVRRNSSTVHLVDTAWTPGASLTMNLATGVPSSNLPAPWSLDGDPDAATGLFFGVPTDGKLPLKVDCQF